MKIQIFTAFLLSAFTALPIHAETAKQLLKLTVEAPEGSLLKARAVPKECAAKGKKEKKVCTSSFELIFLGKATAGKEAVVFEKEVDAPEGAYGLVCVNLGTDSRCDKPGSTIVFK